MAINISFGGTTIQRPGAFAIVDTANMVPVSLGALRSLAVIGVMDESASLAPGRAYAFTEPSEARKALTQGELLDVMYTAWQHGANLIYVVPVNKPVAASITLKDNDEESPADALKLTARAHGTKGNGITVEVANNDLIVAFDGRSESYDATKTVEELAALVNAGSALVTAEVVGSGTAVLGTLAETNLSGGGAGAPVTDSDWEEALEVLEQIEVDGLIPVTTAQAIQAKVDAHVQAMSNIHNRRRRRAFYGHAVGESIENIKNLAAALNNERALLATPCPMVADSSGNRVTKPSYYTAAAVAGIWSGQEPQEPVTYKAVKFAGLEKQYKPTEIVELLNAHVCVVEVVKNGGYRIVQGITTSSSADLTQAELSVSTLKDIMSENLETHFENKYVGKAGVRGVEITMYNDLVSMLEQFVSSGLIAGYVADSVKVTRNGTTFNLEWQGTPTLPINNFLITTSLTL